MTAQQAIALAERAASHTRRCEMDAESKPSLANLARLKKAEEAERSAWRRAQSIREREDKDEAQ
jgi:hypothetical protein